MRWLVTGWIAGLVSCLAVPARAQGPALAVTLDSGTVARLTWDGSGREQVREQVRLLAPLAATSDSVRFCRYPSSGCGPGSVNPVQVRGTRALRQVEVRHGNHVLRGALWGAGIGILAGGFALSFNELGDTRVGTGTQVLQFTLTLATFTGVGALLGSGGHDWAPAR